VHAHAHVQDFGEVGCADDSVLEQRLGLGTRPEKTGAARGDRYASVSLDCARLSKLQFQV
jgi:hypothetical protein